MRRLFLFLLLFNTLACAPFAMEVNYTNLGLLSPAKQGKIENWVQHGIQSTFSTLGPLKQQTLPVTLKPRYFAFEPVPWASVKRGKVDGIELHFDRYASLKVLIKDWSLYHELAHLYHPLFDYDNFWLSEGLATYLQNIIMLDNGIINHKEFISRLRAGLERGALQTSTIKGPLNVISENMWSLNAQQRVYWSGVAFFVEAELALKAQTTPYNSISKLINAYQRCCKKSNHSARQFILELDKLSRSVIFSNLYSRYSQRTTFPLINEQQLIQLRF
ncbi:hypothetical protein HG263_01700 [Pseudoalteromonas sp. JBTF-M23]|uniref:Peptidase M61 catalytic domain-containing protein n=1 Tax=Pseudoalteromonas caenipelagi TaxID=2726988 RepID=A0A849VBU5_9GAMM|nr:hypothetical protein [Pseudoalteromonas caenipelagi]NOU49267.1 hypothetical protein [Pseudoalteromonas caenipelagi]